MTATVPAMESVMALDDERFVRVWRDDLSIEDRAAIGEAGFVRYRALTGYVQQSIQRAEREQMKPEEATPRVVALEIVELLGYEFPPSDPLLAPWLRTQTLAMVHAWRGVGKTHFALGVAYAVAGGGSFLKWKAPEPHKVLYIDGEMSGHQMKERITALVKSKEPEPPEGYFRIVTPDVQERGLPDLGTATGRAAFDQIIGDAELIVVDNLSALVRCGPENEAEGWVPMAGWALERKREGRAILFVHHSGKNGTQRGTSKREDSLDVVVRLDKPSDDDSPKGAHFRIAFEKTRGLHGPDLDAVVDFEATLGTDAMWTWKESEGATVERVAKLAAMGMKANEIAAELGIHRSTVYRALGGGNGTA